MFLVDANVLLYAVNRSSRTHSVAHRWLETALGGPETVGFTWTTLLAFVRVATQRAALPAPLSVERAFEHMNEWLEAPAATIVDPGRGHDALLRRLLIESGTAGNLVTDAHLAAIALENDATVVSFDRDLGRFAALKHTVPA